MSERESARARARERERERENYTANSDKYTANYTSNSDIDTANPAMPLMHVVGKQYTWQARPRRAAVG